MIVRPMTRNDLDVIETLERACYRAPWHRGMFESELTTNAYAHLFVLEEKDVIYGYSGVWIVSDTATITKVTVRPDYQGRKLGSLLVRDLLERVERAQCAFVSLEVRVSNVRAVQLYRKHGFAKVGIRKHYYSVGEDAIAMVKTFSKEHYYEEVYSGD